MKTPSTLDARVAEVIGDAYATWTAAVERAVQLGIDPSIYREPQITIGYIVDYLNQAAAPEEYRFRSRRTQYGMVRTALRRLHKAGLVRVEDGGREKWYEPAGARR